MKSKQTLRFDGKSTIFRNGQFFREITFGYFVKLIQTLCFDGKMRKIQFSGYFWLANLFFGL